MIANNAAHSAGHEAPWPDLFGHVALPTPSIGRHPRLFGDEPAANRVVLFQGQDLLTLRAAVFRLTFLDMSCPRTNDETFADALEWVMSDEPGDFSFRACLDAIDPELIWQPYWTNWARLEDAPTNLDAAAIRRGIAYAMKDRISRLQKTEHRVDFELDYDVPDVWSNLTISHRRLLQEAKVHRAVAQSHF